MTAPQPRVALSGEEIRMLIDALKFNGRYAAEAETHATLRRIKERELASALIAELERAKTRTCFECDTPLNGPYCPKCNPIGDAIRAEEREALLRADKIIEWMAGYLGRMAPPSGGLADLNEHFLYMQGIRKPMPLSTSAKEGAPLDHSAIRARATKENTDG